MRSFSIPQHEQNQQTYERSIYHQVQSLQQQQQQQQSVENATVSYGEPLSVNGVPATGIYHNGTWYNAVPQYGTYQPADGQAPLQLVLQQAASQNVPQYEPQTYCYQPLQVQEGQPLGYATAYRPLEPQSSNNPQAYVYQQHSVQQSQSQSQQQQQQQVVQLAPTYYYQPVQMVAGPSTGQPYVAASASLSQLIAAPANSQQQYVTAGSNVQQLIAAAPPNAQQMLPAPAPTAPPPSQLMEQPQQHLSSPQSYNYEVYNYQDAPPPVGLLPTPDMLPQTDEAFGYQCYNYSQPQSPRSPPAMPSFDAPPPMPSYDAPPPMPLGPSTDYIEPETVEVDISMASDVFIARTPDKLVVSLYKLRGRRKPVPGTQNVYINGRVPDCTMSQSKSDVSPDQATYQNGCHEQDLAVAAQLEATPDAPPAMEVAQCYMEPAEHVLYAQEPERMESPPNAADQMAPGFQAFNVIDPSNLLECSALAASRPMMDQNPLILCNADMEKKFNQSPKREATPKPKDVDKKMDVVEQFRAPRRVIQPPVNLISTQQLGLIRTCKSELVKNETKYLRNNYMSDVGRAAKQANKPQRQPEMIVKEILKPPPKLSTQEKNEKLLPELLSISSSKSFQANAESAEHINDTFKIDSESTAESFAVEPGEITDKLISQVFAGHIVAQLCQTASKFAAPQSTDQANSNGTLSIFKMPPQDSPTTIQSNSHENSSPTQSIFKLPAQVSSSTTQSSQVNSNATQSNLELHSPEIPEAAAPNTTQLASPTPAEDTAKETWTQATAMQAAQEIPKAVLKISQESSKVVSKAVKSIPQISKKKAKLLARKNQKPFQPQSQHQTPTKSMLQVGAKPTPKLSQTNYKTTPEFNPKATQDNQKTTLTNFKMSAEAAPRSSQATSKISAQGAQKTSQPSSKVLAEASSKLAPVAFKLPAEENQKTTETNCKSSAEEAPMPAQVHSTISTQGTQKASQANSKFSAEVSPWSTQEAAKLPTQEGFKLPAQVASKLRTEETAKVVQIPTQLLTQDNPKTISKATQENIETLQTSPPNSKLSPELIPKATEAAFDLQTLVSRLPAQEYQKTFKPSSQLSPELIPTQDNQKIFQPSSKLTPDVTLRTSQVASRLFTSENRKLTVSKVSPEVSPRTSHLNTKCSLEVSPKASEVAFKVPAQVKSKLLSQGNPKLFQPISQLSSQNNGKVIWPPTQSALSNRFEKDASELTRSTTQIFSQNKSQLVDATLKCIPLRGASSIILAPSKTIKSLSAKWTMPEKAVDAESNSTQVAAKPSPEFKIVSEVAQPKLKLTSVDKSETRTIKAMQKPTPEDKSEAEIKQAKHSTNLGLPNQFKAASEGAKLVPMGNQTVELKRNQIKWASEGPASVELMANQMKVASVVSEPVELDLKLVPEDADSKVPETKQIKFALEGVKPVKFEKNQATEGVELIESQEHQIADYKKIEEPVEPEENQLKSTAEDVYPVEHEEAQVEIASEGARLVEPEVNQYAESVEINVHEYVLGNPEHSNLNQENPKSGSKQQYLAHPTPAVPETNQTTSLEQAGKPSTKAKPRKIDDLMLNVISAEEPIQPFGVQQQQTISKKKPAKLSKLERKALRREANKAQNELQAAQKAEEKAKAGAEIIPNDETVREPKRKKKKKNINSDTEEVQEDDRNEDSGSEPEIECPALKEVCDPILRRKLMTIIHKIVNL
ncbi:uncharacterized protein LOC115767780 isoform X2 [Drosophila novamexicana]|uniref:uncharacterized protein LOC115767780 isoform X2 n=1 Tax=Drosophila novamexicana TaxID=47314 RepID=UPI0011E5F75B|nr:uncharacterized protein LOC115767780 isoform X2 [Drosophila novamexicana]